MFEYHGWAVISESPMDVDEGGLDGIINKLAERIESLQWESGVFKLHIGNGLHHILTAGLTNHKGYEATELFVFFRYIAEIAPGSYGLLYIRDDEDPHGFNNEFRVWVLARGQLLEQKELLLSPCIPLIEESY